MWDGIIGRVEESDNKKLLNLAASNHVCVFDARASPELAALSDAAAALAQQLHEDPIIITIGQTTEYLGAVLKKLETKIKSISGVKRGTLIKVSKIAGEMTLSMEIVPEKSFDEGEVLALATQLKEDPSFVSLWNTFTEYYQLNEELKAKIETKAEEALAQGVKVHSTIAILSSGMDGTSWEFSERIRAHWNSYTGIKQDEDQQWCGDG